MSVHTTNSQLASEWKTPKSHDDDVQPQFARTTPRQVPTESNSGATLEQEMPEFSLKGHQKEQRGCFPPRVWWAARDHIRGSEHGGVCLWSRSDSSRQQVWSRMCQRLWWEEWNSSQLYKPFLPRSTNDSATFKVTKSNFRRGCVFKQLLT